MDTTALLIKRLKGDKNLRRICGWESLWMLPSQATFSKAFAEFAEMKLPQRADEALIQKILEGEVILHNSRDSTVIETREKAVKKSSVEKISKQKKRRGALKKQITRQLR